MGSYIGKKNQISTVVFKAVKGALKIGIPSMPYTWLGRASIVYGEIHVQ